MKLSYFFWLCLFLTLSMLLSELLRELAICNLTRKILKMCDHFSETISCAHISPIQNQ